MIVTQSKGPRRTLISERIFICVGDSAAASSDAARPSTLRASPCETDSAAPDPPEAEPPLRGLCPA